MKSVSSLLRPVLHHVDQTAKGRVILHHNRRTVVGMMGHQHVHFVALEAVDLGILAIWGGPPWSEVTNAPMFSIRSSRTSSNHAARYGPSSIPSLASATSSSTSTLAVAWFSSRMAASHSL